MVLDALTGGGSAPPGVRRPTFTIVFGAGGGGDGGALGGLAGAVAGALGVALPGADDPWKRSLLSLTLDAGVAPLVDALELVLAADAGAPPVAVGDAGTVSLGYGGADEKLVFTGTIDRIVRGIDGNTRVIAHNGGGELARLRINQSYEQMNAADVATEIASRVSLQTDVLQSGDSFPFLAIDDRSSSYAHLGVLARRAGCIAFVTPAGKLSMVAPTSGDPVQSFAYGSDLIASELADMGPEVGAVTVIGEGAAGSQGQDAWAWFIKDPASVTGTAGSGAPERTRSDAALRTSAFASGAASGMADAAARRKLGGRVRVAGAPAVTAGSVVELTGLPHGGHNGRFLVKALRHRLDKRIGFVTDLTLLSVGGGGGGGGALGGLL